VFESGTIVVPLDGSDLAETALPLAVGLARLFAAPIRFIHILDEDIPLETPSQLTDASATFGEYVDGLMKKQDAGDLPREVHVKKGPAARSILDAASDARMIVLASRGRGGLRGVLGSIADRVVRGATVPVLVVPTEGHAPLAGGTIVVGLDGSTVAEKGLQAARDMGKKLGGRVVLVRAYSLPPMATTEFVAPPVDLITPLQEGAEAYLLEAAKPDEHSYALFGTAVDAIDRVSRQENAVLVVMTSHGKGFARRITLGSQTDRAMHTLHRPLLVVPIDDGHVMAKA
jgi:nucleotide-binding universal stress UspA family protein